MTTEEALALCERVLDRIGGEGDADITVEETDEALLRFANNEPIQHTTARRVELSLGLKLGNRYGQATSQATDGAALDRLVADARRQAELLPEEPDLLDSVGPQVFVPVDACFASGRLDVYDAAARGAAMEAMTAPVRAAGLLSAGIVSNSATRVAMATTGGMRGSYEATSGDWDMTVTADDSTGRSSAWSRDPATIDPAAMGREAVEKARRSANPQPLEPGTYRVVLSPDALGSLLYYIGGGFNARAYKEGRTWLSERLGQTVVSTRVTLSQHNAHPLLRFRPFDGDGVAVQQLDLIRDGVASRLVYDRRTAAEDGAVATGWSGGRRNAGGAQPSALVLAGEGASAEDLLAACDDGVYIERLWYTNWVDPKACVVTGMTRDGLYRVRGGKLAEPLLNLRFNQPLLELFGSVLALGVEASPAGFVAPPLAAERFTLSSGTSF